jgi:hypothetical protein
MIIIFCPFPSNGAPVEWNWQGKTEVLGEKPVPVPLCPPQIPHGLTRDRTWASGMGGRRLTAWAMARSGLPLPLPFTKMQGKVSLYPYSHLHEFYCRYWLIATVWRPVCSPFTFTLHCALHRECANLGCLIFRKPLFLKVAPSASVNMDRA